MYRKINPRLKFEILKYFMTFLISFTVATVVIFLVSNEPQQALKSLFIGPISNMRYFKNVIQIMTPLIFTGLAASVIFRMNVFNLSIEGMFYGGGLAAVFVATQISFSSPLHWILALLASAIIGAVIACIPAYLKRNFSANEVVSSLMLNYIVFLTGDYVIKKFLADGSSTFVQSSKILDTAKLPTIFTSIHIGFVMAVILLIISYYFIYDTTIGYKYRVTSENEKFAKYSGINVSKVFLVSQIIGGIIAGIGGGTHVLGSMTRLPYKWESGFGWDGIIVAIIAKYNPKFLPIGAFILSYIRVGSDIMSRKTDMQNEVVSVIQGVIIILLSAQAFMKHRKHKYVIEEINKEQRTLEGV